MPICFVAKKLALQVMVALMVANPSNVLVTFTGLPDEGMVALPLRTCQVKGVPAGTLRETDVVPVQKVLLPEMTNAWEGVKLQISVVLVVVAPVPVGSSQLLRRVALVPPPVHESSNL